MSSTTPEQPTTPTNGGSTTPPREPSVAAAAKPSDKAPSVESGDETPRSPKGTKTTGMSTEELKDAEEREEQKEPEGQQSDSEIISIVSSNAERESALSNPTHTFSESLKTINSSVKYLRSTYGIIPRGMGDVQTVTLYTVDGDGSGFQCNCPKAEYIMQFLARCAMRGTVLHEQRQDEGNPNSGYSMVTVIKEECAAETQRLSLIYLEHSHDVSHPNDRHMNGYRPLLASFTLGVGEKSLPMMQMSYMFALSRLGVPKYRHVMYEDEVVYRVAATYILKNDKMKVTETPKTYPLIAAHMLASFLEAEFDHPRILMGTPNESIEDRNARKKTNTAMRKSNTDNVKAYIEKRSEVVVILKEICKEYEHYENTYLQPYERIQGTYWFCNTPAEHTAATSGKRMSETKSKRKTKKRRTSGTFI